MNQSRRHDPLERVATVPQTEFEIKQPPSLDFLDEYKNLMEERGISVFEVENQTKVYDLLRSCRRENPVMVEHNSDQSLSLFFKQRFKQMLEQTKLKGN